MKKILLSNDDGIDSPMLVPLARELARLGEVRVVVPDSERSWIGKAITRFDAVVAREQVRDGISMFAVTGTPADCVQLGVHNLFPDPPDLVVSGINLGLNFGVSFVVSSGTVGAALEGWICGLPAIALSMAIPNDAYGLSGAQRVAALGSRSETAAVVARQIVADLTAEAFPPGVDLWSVNLPAEVSPATPRVVARVARSRYARLFVPDAVEGYRHRFQRLEPLEDLADGDIAVLERGEVAISPLHLRFDATTPGDLVARLTRPG